MVVPKHMNRKLVSVEIVNFKFSEGYKRAEYKGRCQKRMAARQTSKSTSQNDEEPGDSSQDGESPQNEGNNDKNIDRGKELTNGEDWNLKKIKLTMSSSDDDGGILPPTPENSDSVKFITGQIFYFYFIFRSMKFQFGIQT